MSWYLQSPAINAGAPAAFDALGLNGLQLQLKSAGVSSFRFTADGAGADSAPLAPEGALVSILNGAAIYFSGRLYQIPRAGAGNAESVRYEVRDAWQDFERNIFQQQWCYYASATEEGVISNAVQYVSHVLLGMGMSTVDGDNVYLTYDSGQVITEIVSWAIARGAYCQLGAIDVSAPVPLTETRDQTCAECVKKMLRLTPDAVAWFDYSVSPPAFNVSQRPNCAGVTLPFTGAVEKIEIKARPDLCPPSVVIRYEQENKVDGQPVWALIIDAWPPAIDGVPVNGLEYGSLVGTMKLTGSSATFQRQPVGVITIPDPSQLDVTILTWLKGNVPGLAQFDLGRLSIPVDPTQTVAPDAGPNTGAPNTDAYPGDYPNQLVHGNIPDWVKIADNVITGQLTYVIQVVYTPSGGNDAQDQAAATYFGTGLQRTIAKTVKGTNSPSETYFQLSGYAAGEPVPYGLAEVLYNALNPLQYEGSCTTVAAEVPPAALGIVINITGAGQSDWAAMNALVQEITSDLDAGRTTYRFGPAGRLTLQDLMEQIRALRSSVTTGAIQQRLNATPPDNQMVDGDGTHPHSDTDGSGGGGASYPWIGSTIADEAGDDETWPPYYAVLGYGQSSFADSIADGRTAAGPPSPLSRFEIDAGNTGDGFSDGEWDSSVNIYNALSLISGDDDPTNDIFWIGATNSGGDGGSIVLTPYDTTGGAGPSLVLSPNLDGSVEAGDQNITLSLSQMIMSMTDDFGAFISSDLSDAPMFMLYDGSDSVIELSLEAEPYLQLLDADGDEIELDLIDGAPILTITASDSSGSSLDKNSVSASDADSGGSFDADASALDGGSASFQECTTAPGGGTFYCLTTDSFIALDAPSGAGSANCPAFLGTTDDETWSMIQSALVPCPDSVGSSDDPYFLASIGSGGLAWQDFADAVQGVIAGLSWTAVCNDSGGITITADA